MFLRISSTIFVLLIYQISYFIMSRVTTFLRIIFEIMIMTFTVSNISIYHTQMFYLVQMVCIILASIFVNLPYLYTEFLLIYFI